MKHRVLSLCLLLVLAGGLALPAASALTPRDSTLSVSAISKNVSLGDVLTFSPQDFRVAGQGDAELDSIVLTSLPKAAAGVLRLGDAELQVGDCVSMSAVEGMKFVPLFAPVEETASFTFVPVFSDGVAGPETSVSVYLLAQENTAPAAEDLKLCTYKNIAVEGVFAAVDPEGDELRFQLVKKPARGQVEIREDGTFVYTPYENKTGKDTFTYVAVDSVGNTSPEATVKVTISKAKTKVTYADLDGNAAHKAAIRLAEEGIMVGAQIDGAYYFQPDLPVSRDQFLVMAMSAAGEKALAGVSATGFSDDADIPTWAKGYVSAALMSGTVQGVSGDGQVRFSPAATVTRAEAAVMVDRLLRPEDAALETFGAEAVPAWASQSVANLRSAAVLSDSVGMDEGLSRGEAAKMLCAMLEYLDEQDTGWFGK